jgi:homoserine kinase
MKSVKTLSVRVAASSSNLGPGFDLLGLALDLFVEVNAQALPPTAANHTLETGATYAGGWPRTDNLLMRAFDAVWAARDVPPPAFHFQATSAIPVARGLGSSGAATAAGLLLGNQALPLYGHSPLPVEALHRLGIALEGHPDNVTAALFGGCTLCLPPSDVSLESALAIARQPDSPATLKDSETMVWVPQSIHPEIGFAVAWGSATTPTERARAVLPATVSFADAKENPRRLALLLEGLRTRDPTLLKLGVHDRLHHEARLALIPGGRETLDAALQAGATATAINGSGSSLLALGIDGEMDAIREAMATTLARFDRDIQSHVLRVVRDFPRVLVR